MGSPGFLRLVFLFGQVFRSNGSSSNLAQGCKIGKGLLWFQQKIKLNLIFLCVNLWLGVYMYIVFDQNQMGVVICK